MAFHIANFFDAPRFSARAGETLEPGDLVKVLDWGNGERKLMKLSSSDAASLSGDKYAVVTRFTGEPNVVSSSTIPARLGSRIVTISSGDHVVEVRKTAILEYSLDELDASLQSTPPTVNQELTSKGEKFCAVGTAGQNSGKVVGQVFRIFGTRYLIELK